MTVEELAELLDTLSGEKIEEVLEKPFAPKDEKPFGDIDFEQIKGNQHGKPEGEKHECTEECEENCPLANPVLPEGETKPGFQGGQNKAK